MVGVSWSRLQYMSQLLNGWRDKHIFSGAGCAWPQCGLCGECWQWRDTSVWGPVSWGSFWLYSLHHTTQHLC